MPICKDQQIDYFLLINDVPDFEKMSTPCLSNNNNNLRGGSRGRVQGVHTPLPPEMTCGFLIQLVFCKKICGLLVLK